MYISISFIYTFLEHPLHKFLKISTQIYSIFNDGVLLIFMLFYVFAYSTSSCTLNPKQRYKPLHCALNYAELHYIYTVLYYTKAASRYIVQQRPM